MMAEQLDVLLDTVEPPELRPDFVTRLHAMPLPVFRTALFREWWRYLVPLPVAAALAGFAVGFLTAPPMPMSAPAIDLAAFGGGDADAVVVELLEDILWPYDSPITLASH